MKKLLILLIVFGVGGVIAWPSSQVQRYVESTPPQIFLQPDGLTGMGVEARKVKVTVSDDLSGASSLTVLLEQGKKQKPLLQKRYEKPVLSREEEFEIPGAEAEFEEGTARLVISAVDATLRGNTGTLEVKLPVDRTVPRVELLSQQHVATQGGSQFVVYRVQDDGLAKVGVRVGDEFYPGVGADKIDSRYAGSNIFVSLFAIPLGYESAVEPMTIFASDVAGNERALPMRFRIKPYAQATASPNLGTSFLERKVPELLPGYLTLSMQKKDELGVPSDDLAGLFKVINEDYRNLLDQKLDEILSRTTEEKFWEGVFVRPLAAATSSNFGEKRSYFHEGQQISTSVHLGFDLASVRNDEVVAVNNGKVVFAGDLGIYGNTIVLDHGLGLFSLYSHLSSFQVTDKDKVERGQKLGRTGETGLAGGDHLHFEFRVGKLPVSAIEWWDKKWIEDQFLGKLDRNAPQQADAEESSGAGKN